MIVVALGFDAKNRRARAERLGGKGAAGAQAAAATADQQRIEFPRVAEYLQPRRALPGDNVRVVIGRDQHAAVALGQGPGNGFAIFAITVIANDLRAQGARVVGFDAGGVFGHNDARGHAGYTRRRRNPLRMVAGGPGDHARAPLGRGQARNAVVSAAKLKGAAHLQDLRLEPHATARIAIQKTAAQQRRAHGLRRDTPRRLFNGRKIYRQSRLPEQS